MRSKSMAFLIVALLGVSTARAQEVATEEEAQDAQAPRRTIRVLEHPYDIASFYRSSATSGPLFHAPVDFYNLRPTPYGPPTAYRSQYPIASYYRSQQGNYFGLQSVSQNPYAIASYYRSSASNDVRFWYGGYGAYAPRGERRDHGRYWSSIGENGDVFLMAPTILAPVGALSAIYYSGR